MRKKRRTLSVLALLMAAAVIPVEIVMQQVEAAPARSLASGNYGMLYASAESAITTSDTIWVTGLTLNKTALTMTAGAQPEVLVPVFTPTNATDRRIAWGSSNSNIATVDTNGSVTPIAAGTTTIVATSVDGGKVAFCQVTVNPAPVTLTGFDINRKALSMTAEGNTETITPIFTPANATNKTVTWLSTNPGIASVNTNGVVTPLVAGTTTIIATAAGNNRSATCEVTVSGVGPTGITLNKTNLYLTAGSSSETLIATVTPSNATNKTVTWTSGNTSVATINSVGTVTPIAAGTATITASTANGTKTTTCTVTVSSTSTNISGFNVYRTGDSSVDMRWNGTSGSVNVEVRRRSDDARIDSRTTSSQIVSFSGLYYDTEYSVYVDGRYMQSFTIRNMSYRSDSENVRVEKTGSTSVDVTWSNTSGDVLVELKRRNESYTTYSRTTSSRRASFSGLNESTEYEVYIDGQDMTSFTIRNLSDYNDPRNMVIDKRSSSAVDISWDGTYDSTLVEIKRRTDNRAVDSRRTSSRSVSFTGLSPNTEYSVYINGVYMDRFTLAASQQPQGVPVSQNPQGFTVNQNIPGGFAELSWNGTSGTVGVTVKKGNDLFRATKTSESKIVVYGLEPGTQYSVYVADTYMGNFTFGQPGQQGGGTAGTGTQWRTQPALFRDIRGHWAQTPIEKLARAKVISGFPDGTFRPNATVTREQFIIMLTKMMKYPLVNPKSAAFKDVGTKHRSARHIYTAVQKGIISTKEYGKLFSPERSITREEMAIMIARALKYSPEERALYVKDKTSILNKGLVGAVMKNGIIRGLPDHTFRPRGTLTRGEAAAALSRVVVP